MVLPYIYFIRESLLIEEKALKQCYLMLSCNCKLRQKQAISALQDQECLETILLLLNNQKFLNQLQSCFVPALEMMGYFPGLF